MSQDESGDKANVIACPFNLRLMRKTPVPFNLQMIYGPSGLNNALVRQLLRSTRIGRLMMVGLALLYMVKHFEKHGGDGLSWLASWLRQQEINEHERTSIEMRCLVTGLHLSGTYDQLQFPMFGLNGNCCPADCSDC